MNIPSIVQLNYILENVIIFLSICSFHASAVVIVDLLFPVFICIEVKVANIIVIPIMNMPFRAICKCFDDTVVDVGVQNLHDCHDKK